MTNLMVVITVMAKILVLIVVVAIFASTLTHFALAYIKTKADRFKKMLYVTIAIAAIAVTTLNIWMF